MNITGGKYNSRIVKTVEFDNIKPTLSKIRQGIFNTLASIMDFDNKVFFDMFSGSGIMSLEAISRGFDVVAFEKDKKTAILIKALFKTFNANAQIYFGDSIKNITKISNCADVIFIDPPYNSNLYEESLKIIELYNKLNKNGIIVLEHPIEKQINKFGFEIIKAKLYGKKQITYLTN